MALERHQVHLDMRVVPTSATYNSGTGLTTFVTPCPCYADVVVRLPTGTQGALTRVSATQFTAVGNYTGGTGVVLGCACPMEVELAEVIPRDEQDRPELPQQLLLRRATLFHRSAGGFNVEVEHQNATVRPTETHEYDYDLSGFSVPDDGTTTREWVRFTAGVGAYADRCTIRIVNETYKPCHIAGLEFDIEILEGLR
jgi:hypothetical protein